MRPLEESMSRYKYGFFKAPSLVSMNTTQVWVSVFPEDSDIVAWRVI